jgi:hypothetical protein
LTWCSLAKHFGDLAVQHKFTIEPYVGAIPIRFGMKPDEVEAQIGPPISILPSHFGNRIEERANVNVGYSVADDTLCEAVFSPGSILFFQGIDLFSDPDPILLLLRFDPSPYEWVGMIHFLKLGIRFSGYHDHDEAQKAIGIVREGYWDEFVDDFVPYSVLQN